MREGSSPLTRGKRPVPGLQGGHPGLIPAHAGKTHSTCRTAPGQRAHPRSRGENLGAPDPHTSAWGSSPLTRGKHHHRCHRRPQPGLIPAHAGKTRPESRRPTDSRAHPRSRGENAWRLRTSQGRGGSSPLTRGKRERRRGSGARSGLIPAHAGKTPPIRVRLIPMGAHPRSRGENPDRQLRAGHGAGSSPLTRGKP